jgi:hypothetical protein
MISAGYRWPLYDTSPTMIPLRRIDSEIIHFGRTNHQPDNAQRSGAACVVTETNLPRQYRAAKIESLPGGQHPDGVDVEPAAAVDAEGRASQLGRLTKLSLSIAVPDTSSTRRLYTPAA